MWSRFGQYFYYCLIVAMIVAGGLVWFLEPEIEPTTYSKAIEVKVSFTSKIQCGDEKGEISECD